MNSTIKNKCRTILVINDVEETRDGIWQMLERDGYRVETARDERDVAKKGSFIQIDLMLVSLEGETANVVAAAVRIRARRNGRGYADYYFLSGRN